MNDVPSFTHDPVMLDEVLAVFEPLDDGVLVDATLGGAGHAIALLEAHPDLRLVGFDQDPTAISVATQRLTPFGDRTQICHARFDRLSAELERLGIDAVAGVLFDLGVSSHQLDVAERGFSFRNDGPLDMRMNPSAGRSAADLVNEDHEGEIADILYRYGDERHSRRIARAIVNARPLHGTAQLAAVVAEAMPAASRRSPGHPARRTFQALRIAVNDELGALESALVQAIDHLGEGGWGAVLSYHSGEDRIVKRVLRHEAGLDQAPPPRGLPAPAVPARIDLRPRGGRTPSNEEIARNPRSKAARLRSFRRLPEAA